VLRKRGAADGVGFINSIRLQIRRIGKRDRVFEPHGQDQHLRQHKHARPQLLYQLALIAARQRGGNERGPGKSRALRRRRCGRATRP
jgi:hypothetical protein